MLALADDGAAAPRTSTSATCSSGARRCRSTESALLPAFDRAPELREAALAIVMEPTANALEVGCNGNLQRACPVRGRAAHSARPWLGDNAIHAAIEALAPIADLPMRDVEIDGLVFREVVSVTTIAGGIAGNVVPDLVEATRQLPLRAEPHPRRGRGAAA